jgi:pantoate--beta-alanine ligase
MVPRSASAKNDAALEPVTTRAELARRLAAVRARGKSIGLVPTMGALHAGHLSLVEASRRECDFTVVTVFVNPSQFGPNEDFARYPRTLVADLAALASLGVDLVFAPPTEEIYRPGHDTFVEVGRASAPLEGRFRPGHFRGVATVVLKLFNLVQPNAAYFGRKDYQQSLVIRRMVEDLDLPIEVRVCPTVREPDGLALSSRNAYLSADERRRALAISRSLRLAAELARQGTLDSQSILEKMRAVLAEAGGIEVDYIALVNPDTLEDVERIAGPTVAAIAAKVGKTRLIDNEIVGTEMGNRG